MADPIVQLFGKNRAASDDQRPGGSHQKRRVTGLMTRLRSAYRAAIRDALEMPDSAATDASDRAS
ncbi:MAG TPA: hypothetical protein VFE11_10145 [Dongiaceae bacterium]|jgi:hypothetical protein|nr:hypothetical protein [Dongiaceae bacterium]